jgi:hypothetical protein
LNHFYRLVALLICASLTATRAEISNPATDWMAGQFGVGVHYLKGSLSGQNADWNKTVESFDAKKFAESVNKTGAKWCLITLGQNSGYYCSPNSVLDRYSGYKPGDRNSNRDLPMDIANALAPYGIRMFFYLPSSVPNGDTKIATAFGLTKKEPGGGNYMMEPEFPPKWGEVIKEWSMRYGDKLWGWWFDGYYTRINYTDSMGRYFSEAVKSGNPKSVLSLAPGTRGAELFKVRSHYADFYAGEQRIRNNNLVCKNRWYTGVDSIGPVQWQSFACFGNDWWGFASGANQYSDSAYVAYSNDVFAHGGAITWDIYVSADGTIPPSVVDQMARTLPRIKTVSALRRETRFAQRESRSLLAPQSPLGPNALGLRDALGKASPVTGSASPWRLLVAPLESR